MKKRFINEWILSGVLSLGLFLTQSAFGQVPPIDDDTNAPPGDVDTNYWANLMAIYSNNLASVSAEAWAMLLVKSEKPPKSSLT